MITTTIKEIEGSELEITGEIPTDLFESFRADVIKKFGTELELPGFRKGHAPDNLIIEKVGDEKILYEMAEEALARYYPEILTDNKIDAISRPEITITKIAKGNPLGFTIKTAIMPEFKLADYQKIAKTEAGKKPEDLAVTDKEIDDTIEEIRKSRAKHTHTDKCDHSKDETKEAKEETPAELPELNDEFAKSLGEFESLEDLKSKIKENLTLEKSRRATDKKRLAIMEGIIDKTKIDLPKILIENELNKLAYEMRHQLEDMGLKYEDYLSHLKKTEEDLRKEWEPEATKRSKFGLILKAIAKEEKITAETEELDKEVAHILEQYPDAKPDQVRIYAEDILVNENVFKFLEGQK